MRTITPVKKVRDGIPTETKHLLGVIVSILVVVEVVLGRGMVVFGAFVPAGKVVVSDVRVVVLQG